MKLSIISLFTFVSCILATSSGAATSTSNGNNQYIRRSKEHYEKVKETESVVSLQVQVRLNDEHLRNVDQSALVKEEKSSEQEQAEASPTERSNQQEPSAITNTSTNIVTRKVQEYGDIQIFNKPINQWEFRDWITLLILLFILSAVLGCMRRIRCCGCDLVDLIACWCCYEICCDPSGGMDYGGGLC